MAGPLSAIWYNYKDGLLKEKREPPIWAVIVGASGLVIGLATYGYKVTQAMGVRLAKISPTRGFAAELATALIITLASQYKLPTSSSQCITGISFHTSKFVMRIMQRADRSDTVLDAQAAFSLLTTTTKQKQPCFVFKFLLEA